LRGKTFNIMPWSIRTFIGTKSLIQIYEGAMY